MEEIKSEMKSFSVKNIKSNSSKSSLAYLPVIQGHNFKKKFGKKTFQVTWQFWFQMLKHFGHFSGNS